jgi:hypothetical protein
MFTRKGVPVIAGVLALAAAAAWAGPGSVISSFRRYVGENPTAVYRDADYVHVVNAYHFWPYTMIFTPTGSYVGGSWFPGLQFIPEDADHSFLGSSYITLAVEIGIMTFPKGGGGSLRWDHRDLEETLGYAHRPGSPYYFVGVMPESEEYTVYVFNTGGSLVSTFTPAYWGGLAASDRFAGVRGEYLITDYGLPCGVYDPGGSLVATFRHETGCGVRGGTAGPGYPASWGTTLWIVEASGSRERTVFQIDLGNGTPSTITPASLGKVKALFR